MSDFPTLRLELNNTKYQLISALDDRHEDLKKMIEQSFDKALPHLQSQIDRRVEEALFHVINNAIEAAEYEISNMIANEFAQLLGSQLEESIRRKLSKEEN